MPLSDDPVKRKRQLANLPNLRGEASVTSWQPGDAPHLVHGARTRLPQQGPEWSPAVTAAIADLEPRVGAELRGDDGEIYSWATPSIEAVAIQRVAAWRADRRAADLEAKGQLKRDDIDLVSRVAERYDRSLERHAMTLKSRLDAQSQASSVFAAWVKEQAERNGSTA